VINIDAKKLGADLKAIRRASGELRTELAGEEVMVGLAEQAATIVQARTQRGVDADGAAFAPYSEGYLERRRKKGRSEKPDLTFSGRMLGNMTGKFLFYRKSAVVFSRSEEANKASRNSRLRDFFDVRLPAEIEALGRELDRQVQAALRRVGLGGTA
jgi:hypothetical protein